MSNPFTNRTLPLSGPATDAIPVTPNDNQDLPDVAVALYIETGGTVAVVTVKGASRSLTVDDFSILPLGVIRVLETGTTATGIHAMLLA